jgi:hypothetical protein
MCTDRARAAWLALAIGVALPGGAFAGDGALEINAACVATGCFPGDTAGLPITITTPGSYRLTSNLSVPLNTDTAIRFDVANVTLDLGGFVISGPVTCSGSPSVCTGASAGLAGFGVQAIPGFATIRNGTIQGMGRAAIGAGSSTRVEAVLARANGVHGITGDWGSDGWIVDRCIAIDNGDVGIRLNAGTGRGSLVVQNVVRNNGGVGIQGNSYLVNNTITDNGDLGSASNAHLLGNVFVNNKDGANTQQTSGAYLLGNNWCGTDGTCP